MLLVNPQTDVSIKYYSSFAFRRSLSSCPKGYVKMDNHKSGRTSSH